MCLASIPIPFSPASVSTSAGISAILENVTFPVLQASSNRLRYRSTSGNVDSSHSGQTEDWYALQISHNALLSPVKVIDGTASRNAS